MGKRKFWEAFRWDDENDLRPITFERHQAWSGQGIPYRLRMIVSTSVLVGILERCDVFLPTYPEMPRPMLTDSRL